ncbi:MAG: hypothetical protein KC493_02695 [Bacteriovoracaceae bacterium]|nr:hypothetical protein [Bacteriovoracaceae bacterium]
MKPISAFMFSLLFLMTACDQPRDRRTAYKTKGLNQNEAINYNYYNNDGESGTNGSDGSNGTTSTDGTNGTTSTDGSNGTNPELPTCSTSTSWSTDGQAGFDKTHTHIGAYSFCRSQTSDTEVYIQLQNPILDAQLCVIPTYTSGNRAIYVGEPRCLVIQDNKKIYKLTLLKNRTGYQNFQVTGVMIMKDKAFFYPAPFYQYLLSPDAFLFCSQWLDQTGDSSYCYAFDSVGQYVYHQY